MTTGTGSPDAILPVGMRHEAVIRSIPASPEILFARLDDPARIGAHMSKPSAMMLGGTMEYQLDDAGGQAVGSEIRMTGTFLGLRLTVVEAVTERAPPYRKVWETVGQQNIMVIDWYRMGFSIEPEGASSMLTVFIDYTSPKTMLGLVFSPILAPVYARWCVRRIAADAVQAFGV